MSWVSYLEMLLRESGQQTHSSMWDSAALRERNRRHRNRNLDRLESLWDEDRRSKAPREYERIRPGRPRMRSPVTYARSMSSSDETW
jgi:hypothetical protein